jgi:enamine deaminase RidA (YjgF/YER057c/UK114 family)
MVDSAVNGRQVAGTIDSGDVYASRVAAGGGFAFFAGTALDDRGDLAAETAPVRPYQRSEAARARREAEYVFGQWKRFLPEVGSALDQVLQVEQYVHRKNHSDGYFAEALRGDLLGTGTAVGATAQVGDFHPPSAAVNVTGVAVVPDPAAGRRKAFPGVEGSPTGKFADVVTAGPYLFTTVFPMDRKAQGLPTGVRVPDWSWNDSEIRSEARWAVAELERKLTANGATLADVVDYTLFLSDLGDLYEFDLVAREAFGDDAPARTVMPMRGSALPRREGAIGHSEGAARLEIQFRCLLPGRGADKTVVGAAGADTGHQSAGVRVGPLLWLSSQSASDPVLGAGAAEQIEDVLGQLAGTCADAGTDLSNLVRIRLLATDQAYVADFSAALRKVVPTDPPAVCVVIVDALPVLGASVAIDGVAVVPAG